MSNRGRQMTVSHRIHRLEDQVLPSWALPEVLVALVWILAGREGGRKEDLLFVFVSVCFNTDTGGWNWEKCTVAVKLIDSAMYSWGGKLGQSKPVIWILSGWLLYWHTKEGGTVLASRTLKFCFLVWEQAGSNLSEAVSEFPYDWLICVVVIFFFSRKNLVE